MWRFLMFLNLRRNKPISENSDHPDMQTTKTRNISENPENPEIEEPLAAS